MGSGGAAMIREQYVRAGRIGIRCLAMGEQGETALLLHGLGASADIWAHNMEALAECHRVYAIDLPGFGRSGRPETFSPADYTGFIDDFMKALDIDRAHLIGQSLGGGIAIQQALRFPGKVDKLVLVDSAGLGKEVIWTLRAMSLPMIGELFSRPSRAGVRIFFQLAVRNPSLITGDFIDLYYELFSRPGFSRFLLEVIRSLVDIHGVRDDVIHPILERLQQIKSPTLILWGEKDRVLPLKHAYQAKERIPGSELYIFQDCGHLPFFEKSEEFNRRVLHFLTASPPPPGSVAGPA